ncbi:WD40-repeat-containing domain protein [Cryomyces antarcticus]
MTSQPQFPTRQLAKLTGHNGPVHAVAYSAGLGQYILTGSADRLIRLYNPHPPNTSTTPPYSSSSSTSSSIHRPTTPLTNRSSNATSPSLPEGRLIQTYAAHGYEVLDLCVSADNARFASVGGDKSVFYWDVATAKTLRRWAGHAGRVNCCAFGGEGEAVVLSGSYDGTVRLWDTKSPSTKPLMTLSEARDSVSALSVVGHEIMTGSVDGRVRVYDLRRGVVGVDVVGYPVTSLTPTRANDALLLSTLDSSRRLLDRSNGALLRRHYMNENYRIRSTLALNDSVAVSGAEDGSVWVWDVLDGSVRHRLFHDSHNADVDDASTPATGSAEGKGGNKRAVVSAVAFNEAKREWVSAGGNGVVVVWGGP